MAYNNSLFGHRYASEVMPPPMHYTYAPVALWDGISGKHWVGTSCQYIN